MKNVHAASCARQLTDTHKRILNIATNIFVTYLQPDSEPPYINPFN